MSKKFFMNGHYQWNAEFSDYCKRVLDLIDPREEDMILEVGVGKGRYAVPISEVAGRVVGGDINQFFLAECREKNLALVLLDCENLPIRDNAFDKTICLSTMTHIENYDESIEEPIRVSEIGGEVIMDIANLLHVRQMFSKFITLMVSFFRDHTRIPFYPKFSFQVTRPFREKTVLEYVNGRFGSTVLLKARRCV